MQKALLYVLFFLCFLGCSSPKPITSTVNPVAVNKIGIVPHLAIVQILNSKNEIAESREDLIQNSISDYADEEIDKFLQKQRIEKVSYSTTSEEDSLISNEILSYFKIMNEKDINYISKEEKNYNNSITKRAFNEIKISDKLAQTIKNKDLRFFLSTISIGFTRTKKNELNRKIGNVGKYILASGIAYGLGGGIFFRGIPYRSNTYLFLIDAEQKNLAMFIKKTEEFDPFDKERFQEQLRFGLENYWVYHAAYHKSKYGSK